MNIVVHTLTTLYDGGEIETTVHATVHDALENLRGCLRPEEVANVPDSELIEFAEEDGWWVLLTQHELEIEVSCLCDANLPCPLHDKAA